MLFKEAVSALCNTPFTTCCSLMYDCKTRTQSRHTERYCCPSAAPFVCSATHSEVLLPLPPLQTWMPDNCPAQHGPSLQPPKRQSSNSSNYQEERLPDSMVADHCRKKGTKLCKANTSSAAVRPKPTSKTQQPVQYPHSHPPETTAPLVNPACMNLQ
jgi:hypothetical protein